jgi:hypothetical protein
LRVSRGKSRVPTGLPDRRMVLRVLTVDGKGHELTRAERVYGRVLVDANGQVVPSFAAKRLAADTRLLPRETRNESFELEAPPAGEVRAELAYQALAPEIARHIGVAPPAEELLLEARVPFGAPGHHGRRGGLPAVQVARVDGP